MLTKEQGFERIFAIADLDYTHQDYARCVELRNKYKALMTGEGADYLIHRFQPRESPELFAQRLRLTQLITPAICNILVAPSQKIPSVKPIVKEAGYTIKNDKDKEELDKLINNWWGDQSLDEYLRANYLSASDVDPNSFMIIKFNKFDGRFEKPNVYSTIVGCESVVDFQYANNVLQYLAIRRTILYDNFTLTTKKKKDKEAPKSGRFYQMYINDWEIELTQVDEKMMRSGKERVKDVTAFFELSDSGAVTEVQIYDEDVVFNVTDKTYYTLTEKGLLFQVNFYNTKAGRVPAMRTGVRLDLFTDGRTCVNQFHASMPYLMKTVKTVSELDLSQSLHVFLQKFSYVNKCMGYNDTQNQHIECMGGNDPMGNTCKACDGSGELTITSAQEHIKVPLPSNPDKMFDLSKMIHYADIPIDIVKWLDEYLDGLVTKAVNARFNSTMFVEQSIVKTATEKTYDMESVYEALAPEASQYSRAWMLSVRMGAVYKSIDKGLFINHLFPQDWKMESVGQRMARLKEAVDAGANQYTISYLQNDLMDAVYADQPYRLKQFKTMEYFNPFPSANDNEIRAKITAGLVLEYDKVLYTNLKRIINEAERLNIGSETSPSFYDMTREKQGAIIKSITDALIQEINAERLAIQSTMLNTFNSIPN
jgi:hypothetical protein